MTNLNELFSLQSEFRSLRFPDEADPLLAMLLQASTRQFQRANATSTRLLSEIGGAVFQLKRIHDDYRVTPSPAAHISDALLILKSNLQEFLDENGVEMIDLTGKELSDNHRTDVEIRAQSINPDVQFRTVTFMEHPIILQHAKLLCKGVVTVDLPDHSNRNESEHP